MRPAGRILAALAGALLGLVADGWRLPLGIALILAGGWLTVGRGAGGASGFVLAALISGYVGVGTVVEGRRGGRPAPPLDSARGGRVPDRDR